jgi:hypothetical protein
MLCFVLQLEVKAEENDTATFVGYITNEKTYMEGDYPSVNDFSINGYVVRNNKNYDIKEAKITNGDGMVTVRATQYKIILYFEKDNFSVNAFSDITVVDFAPQLNCNLEDSLITIDSLKTNSSNGSRTLDYYSTIRNSLKMSNQVGNFVEGDFNFSKAMFDNRIGFSTIDYEFSPYNIRYNNTYKGKFILNITVAPKITITKDSIKINLNNNDKRYTFKVNGKEYTKNTITKLDPKTKYKIEIIQNNIPDLVTQQNKKVSNVLYTTTVTTKSK